MALLLSFDTATPHCAVVLCADDRVLAHRVQDDGRLSHAEKLNVFVAAVLADAGRTLEEVDAIGVGTGPGSYTGLRIGLSAAKGLAFALDVPLLALPTLDVLAHELAWCCAHGRAPAPGPTDLALPMIDARRMEVWTHAYGPGGTRTASGVPLVLDDAWAAGACLHGRPVVYGDGADKAAALWSRHPSIIHVPGIRPSLHGLASCAAAAFRAGDAVDPVHLVPYYGKEANLTRPRAGGG